MKQVAFSVAILLSVVVSRSSQASQTYTEILAECRRIIEAQPSAAQWREPGYEDAVLIKRFQPKVPFNSPWKRYACVVVRFDIDTRGRTENVELLGRSPAEAPHGYFLKTEEAILKWRYKPAQKDGKPIRREDRLMSVGFEVR